MHSMARQAAALAPILERAGFVNVRWMSPAESGFYQPLVIGNAPS